ncbi:MAG: HlyD family efflux transporter periplasmic adaptor subunit [Maribacter sp.]|nr:HlyD family efflux transporter periplasmic adaptor subunit [Maribacter sp.]
MSRLKILLSLTLIAGALSCNDKNQKADGYGNFEATETIVAAQANGKIVFLALEEGEVLEKNKVVGIIDTVQLSLQKNQLLASKTTIASKSRNVLSQRKVLKEQLKLAQLDQVRLENLKKENAATQKQLDDINTQVDILKQQIKSVETQNAPIINEVKSVEVQMEIIDDQIKKSSIKNPLHGTVLVKYVEPNEIATFGKPLYKIADLDNMVLRVYVSEKQLATIKIGQEVTIKIDTVGGMKSYLGTVSWISDTAEFTPKIIQTKEERVSLVYATKISVKNDGSLKIGMPAEMWIGEENIGVVPSKQQSN